VQAETTKRKRVMDSERSPTDLAGRLALAFDAEGYELYLVGGVVRDSLLGQPLPNDLDFATSAPPPQSKRILESAGASSVYLIGERFGTVGAVFSDNGDPTNVEVTTYRQDQYLDDTRFPEVTFAPNLEDDLARRDFTMNAIAFHPLTGEKIDPWGGEGDIALAVVRAVGDPEARFTEDPLRMLRAARFAAQLGFRIDWQTEQAMAHQAASLERISRERILAELTRLLLGDYADAGLEVLRRTSLLHVAVPELKPLLNEADGDIRYQMAREKDLWDHTLRVVRQSSKRPNVRWAALLHDAAKPLTRGIDESGEVQFFGHERVGADLARRALERLRADKALRESVPQLVELHGRPAAYDASWSDSAVRRLGLDAGDEWDDLLELAAADVTSSRDWKRQRAALRVAELRKHMERLQSEASLAQLVSQLDGDELMRLFERPPGPWIKAVKNHLRDLVFEGTLAPGDREAATLLAQVFIDEVPA
jgi:poly(A) polymerase